MINYFDIKNKFVVYGLGISGVASLRYLAKNFPNQLIATNDNFEAISKTQENLKDQTNFKTKIKYKNPQDIVFDKDTVVVNSPGISIFNPPHPILSKALENGAMITCDVELFYQINKQHKFIAVTGTNGKSTTASLINHIQQNIDLNCNLGGNIGIACFDIPEAKSDQNYTLEISSYQIDLLHDARFEIATLNNITPDHIERYGNFENYCLSKKRIFNNQVSGDFAVINIDNKATKAIFDELNLDKKFLAQTIAISTDTIVNNGLSIIGNNIYINLFNQNFSYELYPKFLVGKHNSENIAIAFSAALCNLYKNYPSKFTEDTFKKIINIIENFTGLKHRLQFLGKIDEINFYNDSKATNADSTSFALKAFDNIFWILGGRAKTGGIESLVPFFNKIKKAYLIGEASDDFAKILDKNNVKFEKCKTLDNATKKAFIDAKESKISNKTLLLSPACASFDQWQNFEERGNYFCEIFNELKAN